MKFLKSTKEKFRTLGWTGSPGVIVIERLNETFQQLTRNAAEEER